MLRELKQLNKTVGTKQVARAIRNNQVMQLFLAKDADSKVIKELIDLCHEKDIEIIYVKTMKELGKACGIEVKAASAAILKQEN